MIFKVKKVNLYLVMPICTDYGNVPYNYVELLVFKKRYFHTWFFVLPKEA